MNRLQYAYEIERIVDACYAKKHRVAKPARRVILPVLSVPSGLTTARLPCAG